MPKKWYTASKPYDIQPIPWLAPEAVAYLESIIQPEFDILEHGAGGSTLWFAERCKSVTSFENNPDWLMIVKKNAPENVTLFSQTKTLRQTFDLILIDGEPVEHRAGWIKSAIVLIKSGGWVVLDNANRPEYEKERAGLKQYADLVHTVDSNPKTGHTYLVTEFWRVK